MNCLTTELFFTQYNLMMFNLDKDYCLGCSENYTNSFKYHTCYYMTGDRKYQYRELAINLVLAPHKIVLNQVDMLVVFDWISKREIENTLTPIILFREILNKNK